MERRYKTLLRIDSKYRHLFYGDIICRRRAKTQTEKDTLG